MIILNTQYLYILYSIVYTVNDNFGDIGDIDPLISLSDPQIFSAATTNDQYS